MLKTKNKHLRYVITFFAVLCSSLLQTFVIEIFVHSAGLLSGGFTGVAILIDRAASPEIHAFFPSASRHDQLIPEILLSAADF